MPPTDISAPWNLVINAGLVAITEALSATAALPAYAIPKPDVETSANWNAAAFAPPATNVNADASNVLENRDMNYPLIISKK